MRQIQQVHSKRQIEYDNAQGLSTSALPTGVMLKSDLIQALSYSLSSDDDYLAWAQQSVSNCQFGSQFNAGFADSQATKYKTMFVNLWTPIANQYDLPQTSTGTM